MSLSGGHVHWRQTVSVVGVQALEKSLPAGQAEHSLHFVFSMPSQGLSRVFPAGQLVHAEHSPAESIEQLSNCVTLV
jgi:hypothetical protein